ncbi:hypothetical protein BGX28_001245 [Mortierella sp. GBA30]|nr:hypothetical protein BGX28_001245 [Mortierella sp. GBA30]
MNTQVLSEGYDLNEYKPWRDGTVTPHQGSIHGLRHMRSTMLEPWPVEESRAKDECTRVLHRMREQLNVVINLQIHLRSMIKTVPSHMSFLFSVRHPGQVSIELLHALYGPQFMQSSAFRAIEQLLWGKKQPPRIEHHHHQRYQQQQQQRPYHQYPQHHYSRQYSPSQYDGHDGFTGASNHSSPEHQPYHHPQYQQEHGCLMEDEMGCEFEEAYDEQPYQEPMLDLDHSVYCTKMTLEHDLADGQKARLYVSDDKREEDIEALAVSNRRVGVMSTGRQP